jgi:hypothetical protein
MNNIEDRAEHEQVAQYAIDQLSSSLLVLLVRIHQLSSFAPSRIHQHFSSYTTR